MKRLQQLRPSGKYAESTGLVFSIFSTRSKDGEVPLRSETVPVPQVGWNFWNSQFYFHFLKIVPVPQGGWNCEERRSSPLLHLT